MSSGLTRRRGAGPGTLSPSDREAGSAATRANSSNNVLDSGPETSYENSENGHKIAFDPRDISESVERSKQPKLTMMEEVLLLGLKDKQVCDGHLVPLSVHSCQSFRAKVASRCVRDGMWCCRLLPGR